MEYEQAGMKGIRAPKFIKVGQSLADISFLNFVCLIWTHRKH